MRRRHFRIVIVAIGMACVSPAVPVAAASPGSLLASILAAGRAQRSVHYVSTARSGAIRVVAVADVGATKGVQRITFSKAGATGHVSVVVSARTAYVVTLPSTMDGLKGPGRPIAVALNVLALLIATAAADLCC